MCRIDAPFHGRPLDENPDPAQRFLQALDEHEAEGNFRSLLTKHLSENWKHEFHTIEALEKALLCARGCNSDSDKCAAFISASRLIESLELDFDLFSYPQSLLSQLPRKYPALFNFAKDVARNCFPKSPYSFYSATVERVLKYSLRSYNSFVCIFYGADYCFTRTFFDDEALTSLGQNRRSEILWQFFDTMTLRSDKSQYVCDLFGPPTLGAHWFLKAIEFLKAWVKHDAEAGRLSSITREQMFKQIESKLKDFDPLPHSPTGNAIEAPHKWLQDIKRELEALSYIHADLTNLSEEEIESWAWKLDYFILPHSSDSFGFATATNDEVLAREREYFVEIYSQLTPLRIRAWIQYAVKQDFNLALRSKNDCRLNILYHSGKCWNTEYRGIWKEEFLDAFSGLNIEDKLRILSGSLNTRSFGWTAESRREVNDWWNGLLSGLVKSEDFPIQLTPRWTLAAKSRLDSEFVAPFIDKSIGGLRRELAEDGKQEHHKQLLELLPVLDSSDPSKALRHRLLLMRSSKVPFLDESISRFSSEEDAVKWYRPMIELANSWGNSRSRAARDECLDSFSHELAEFCLGRLRLRKGEKATDGKYDADQVVEKSPIWRQGYLKALSELDFDLNGKVHKTVFFIKQSDPDEDVRAIAKECYRSVRRANSNRSVEDMKRGIIAAEWWLLMCQRRELNLTVNHEEALKTRRRMLRNP